MTSVVPSANRTIKDMATVNKPLIINSGLRCLVELFCINVLFTTTCWNLLNSRFVKCTYIVQDYPNRLLRYLFTFERALIEIEEIVKLLSARRPPDDGKKYTNSDEKYLYT